MANHKTGMATAMMAVMMKLTIITNGRCLPQKMLLKAILCKRRHTAFANGTNDSAGTFHYSGLNLHAVSGSNALIKGGTIYIDGLEAISLSGTSNLEVAQGGIRVSGLTGRGSSNPNYIVVTQNNSGEWGLQGTTDLSSLSGDFYVIYSYTTGGTVFSNNQRPLSNQGDLTITKNGVGSAGGEDFAANSYVHGYGAGLIANEGTNSQIAVVLENGIGTGSGKTIRISYALADSEITIRVGSGAKYYVYDNAPADIAAGDTVINSAVTAQNSVNLYLHTDGTISSTNADGALLLGVVSRTVNPQVGDNIISFTHGADVANSGVSLVDASGFTHTTKAAVSETTEQYVVTLKNVNEAPTLATGDPIQVTADHDNDPTTDDTTANLVEGVGNRVTLTTAMIVARDEDEGPNPSDISDADAVNYVFTVSSLQNGSIQINDADVNSFTLANLRDGLVSFVHDGGEQFVVNNTNNDANEGFATTTAKPTHFTLSVSDGSLSISGVQFTIPITSVNDAPTLSAPSAAVDSNGNPTAPITVIEGLAVTLSTTHLVGGDVDDVSGDVSYIIVRTSPHGEIRLNGTALDVDDTFTHQELVDGNVTFMHDGSETAAAAVTLKLLDDDEAESAEVTLNFAITPVNDAPTQTPATTAGQPSIGVRKTRNRAWGIMRLRIPTSEKAATMFCKPRISVFTTLMMPLRTLPPTQRPCMPMRCCRCSAMMHGQPCRKGKPLRWRKSSPVRCVSAIWAPSRATKTAMTPVNTASR